MVPRRRLLRRLLPAHRPRPARLAGIERADSLTLDPHKSLWLPLHLHGVEAFRTALDEKLDLARHAHDRPAEHPDLEPLEPPELTTVVFRGPGGDPDNRALLEQINATRRLICSSTVLDGRLTLRLCVLSHRTHREHVDEASTS